MAKRKAGTKKAKQATDGQNGGIVALTNVLQTGEPHAWVEADMLRRSRTGAALSSSAESGRHGPLSFREVQAALGSGKSIAAVQPPRSLRRSQNQSNYPSSADCLLAGLGM